MTPPKARRAALDALIAIDSGEYANAALARVLGGVRLEGRDRHLVTELVYGTCRMRRACDWLVLRHARGPLEPAVRAGLRLGAYQLVWTRIPPHAAVSATVAEVRGPGRALVNAVLRKVAAEVEGGPPRWPDRATELSYPDWIVERLEKDLGPPDAHGALTSMNRAGRMTLRPDGYAQDRASQMVVEHVGAHPGERVLDVCAAPGGKATGMAAGAPALVVAADASLARTRVTARHLGRETPAVAVVADGTASPWPDGSFDRVLVDAPCSGLGALRRRPDARWRVGPDDVERLATLQHRLLEEAIRVLKAGGVLAYSVCTLTSAETAGIDNEIADRHPDFSALPPPGPPWRPWGRGALLLPQVEGTDGMFVLSLRAPGAPL